MTEPFDHQKWSFMLVAIVICWMLLIAAGILGACIWRPSEVCGSGKYGELLNTILASALAFAAGRTSK